MLSDRYYCAMSGQADMSTLNLAELATVNLGTKLVARVLYIREGAAFENTIATIGSHLISPRSATNK
jgi:hypothetical protein